MDYARHDSRLVSHILDQLGYSYDMVKHRQQMFGDVDKLYSRHELLKNTSVTTGGKGEGTTLFYESDFDHMFIVKNVMCTDHPEQFNNARNITLFLTEREDTSPGYTRLKLVRFDGPCYNEQIAESLIDTESGSLYLSNGRFIKAFERLVKPSMKGLNFKQDPRSGPSTPSSNGYYSHDHVFCFPCYCPDIMRRWVSRQRPHNWPPQVAIQEIARLDGHVVPVGFKGSNTQDLEWRICYSLAELHLMRLLNPTQVKLYILLKQIAKSVIQKRFKDITSYVMKNVILWTCERSEAEMFCEQVLLERLTDAVCYLRKCLIENNLPSYMIPERNLFAGRLDVAQRQKLTELLDELLTEGGSMVLRCGKIRDAMTIMARTPEQLKEFSEKRDKVETLALMMYRIRAETYRPEMSMEERNQLVSQNEEYIDLNRHIDLLIHFDERQLEEMGKTREEINDLWRKSLSIVLS